MADKACDLCGRPILFAGTSSGGKAALDAAPRADGFVVTDQYGCTGPTERGAVPDLSVRYVPHRLTCARGKAGG